VPIAQYYAWENDGRPITPARPVREVVDRMKVAYPRAAHLFSWYADDAHYQSDFPQDHTPYSQTPWPITPNPYPYVFATDIMHRPDLGADCNVLFGYWITEARAGRMPWLKYLIWRGQIYHVRDNWLPRAASGHFDHIHMSTRTDHRDTSLGAWSLTPVEDDMFGPTEQALLNDMAWRVDAFNAMSPVIRGGTYKGQPCALVLKLNEIDAQIEALAVSSGLDPAALKAAVQAAVHAEIPAIAEATAAATIAEIAD